MNAIIRIYAYTDGTFAKAVCVRTSKDEIVSWEKKVLTPQEVVEEHNYLVNGLKLKSTTTAIMGKKVLYRTEYTEE